VTSSIAHVLSAPCSSPSIHSIDRVRAQVADAAARYRETIDRAIVGGFESDRLGYAFACGYAAALASLVPDLEGGRLAALCATEEGGAHPKAIATRLTEGASPTIDGRKLFATMATHVEALLVVASVGPSEDGRNRLRVALVDAHAPGVTMTRLPDAPFAPEIPHAEVRFAGAPVERVLEGDGYDRYLKPFRTIEDVHILCATLAYVAREARAAGWPREFLIEIAALISTGRDIARSDPLAPATHVSLAGMFAMQRALAERVEPNWSSVTPDVRDRWLRDRKLLDVAGRARGQRLEAAVRALGLP
jgi:hypothetical protein